MNTVTKRSPILYIRSIYDYERKAWKIKCKLYAEEIDAEDDAVSYNGFSCTVHHRL